MAINATFGVSTWLWTSPFQKNTIGLFSKIKNDAGDDPSIAPMLNMVQGLLMKAKSEM